MDNDIELCQDNVVHSVAVSCVLRQMPDSLIFQRASEFFKALGDETRSRLIWALNQRELCVYDLAAVLGMTSSAVSHQLSVLRKAGLVKYRRGGREVFYSLADGHVRSVLEAGIEHAME